MGEAMKIQKSLWTKSSTLARMTMILAGFMLVVSIVMFGGQAVNAQSTVLTAGAGLSNLAEKIAETLNAIYQEVRGIITIVAVVLIAILIVLNMITRNPRNAESHLNWIKRIAIGWLAFMFLGYAVQWFNSLTDGTIIESPWTA